MTPNPDHKYSKRPPAKNAKIFIGDGTELVVEYAGCVGLIFHGTGDVRVSLESVSIIPSVKVNLFSLRLQAKEAIIFDATGAHLMGGRLFFPKDRAGFRLNATRRPPPSSSSPPSQGTPALLAVLRPPEPLPPPLPPRAPMPEVQPVRTQGVSAMPPSPGGMVAVEETVIAGFPPCRPMHGMPGTIPSPPPPRAPIPVVQQVRTPGVADMPPSSGVMVAVEETLVARFPHFPPMHGMPGTTSPLPSPFFFFSAVAHSWLSS